MLKQRWNIVVSIILGLVINHLVWISTAVVSPYFDLPPGVSVPLVLVDITARVGLPFRIAVSTGSESSSIWTLMTVAYAANAIFYAALVFGSLNLLRHFRIKKTVPSTEVAGRF